jgi:hypothetical protein
VTARAAAPEHASEHEPAPRQSTLHGPVHAITHCAPPLQLTLELAPTRTLQLVLLQVMLLLAAPSCVQRPPGPHVTLHEDAQAVVQVAPEPQTKFPLALTLHEHEPLVAHAQSLAPPPPEPQGHEGPGHEETGAPQSTEANDSARVTLKSSARTSDRVIGGVCSFAISVARGPGRV